jgi:outer membrane protein assembly factor BamD
MQELHPQWKWLIGFLFVTILTAGCASENLIRPGDTLDVAYKKALKQYRSENYRDAANAFETVINTGRGTDYARSAYFFAAESYYASEQYLLAADAFRQFVALYPQSPKRIDAAFKEALSYYKMSPRYKIDQKYTRKSIEQFRLFLSQYPDSERSEEAAKYLTEMRSKLAKKNYNSAKLYMRTDQYKAAVIFYDLTIDQFPETKWAEKALVEEIAAYVEYANESVQDRQGERFEKAVESYEKYLQLFPNGENRQRAETLVDQARAALTDLSPVTEDTQTSSADQ